MADSIRLVDYFYVTIPNKAGEGARLVQGDDRLGACAGLIGALARAGINVIAWDAVAVHGRYGAIFWVAPKDIKKAQKLVASINAETDAMAAALATLGP